MLCERVYDEDLAQASYFIACQRSGEAIVVDPRRDVEVYCDLAAHHGLQIVAVAETHIHADYLSGTRELAARTGARMYVSDEGGANWRYGATFDSAVRLRHGDDITLGNLQLQAVHTPGHTPEHLSFLVTDGALTAEPGYLLSGDFVFVGDVGRPDLLDAAAGGVDTRFAAAAEVFASLRDHLLTLPDYVQILPGHGSGSACGRALGALATTTVGYERRNAWWAPYLRADDEAGFVSELLSGQPDAHAYFARMKRLNRDGPKILGSLPELREFTADEANALVAARKMVLVDTRALGEVQGTPLTDSLHIPGPSKAASFGAWVIDPEEETTELMLVAPSAESAAQTRAHLLRVGIDGVTGWVPWSAEVTRAESCTIEPQRLNAYLNAHPRALLVDVRNASEFTAGHIPGAVHIPAGQALWRHEEFRARGAGPVVTYCQSGARNSVVASGLRRRGIDVIELRGSYAAWISEVAQ